MRRRDVFASVETDIGITEVIRQDHDHIRRLSCFVPPNPTNADHNDAHNSNHSRSWTYHQLALLSVFFSDERQTSFYPISRNALASGSPK
jgi:hypothetical protein